MSEQQQLLQNSNSGLSSMDYAAEMASALQPLRDLQLDEEKEEGELKEQKEDDQDVIFLTEEQEELMHPAEVYVPHAQL